MAADCCVFSGVLRERRDSVIHLWLMRTLETYPETTVRFLSQDKDPFRNPAGHVFKEGLAALFDGIAGGAEISSLTQELDGIIRLRAVQDFTASQAVAFVFLLKTVLREEFESSSRLSAGEIRVLEARIDQLALLAFDLFMECREQIYRIRSNEALRRVSMLERAFRMRASEPACEPASPGIDESR